MAALPLRGSSGGGFVRGLIVTVTLILALGVVAPGVAQQVELALTPLPSPGTPLAATPIGSPVQAANGVGARLVGQQAAAQATIAAFAAREAAQATRIAALEAALAQVQVTATALVQVAANTVLDPTRQSVTIQTDLGGMLNGNAQAVADARTALISELSRFPFGCRAGFMLIGGNAPTVEEGIALAESIETLLRQFWPDIFSAATAAERFALPNEQPFGQVNIDIFFYTGCQPIE
jgi:hypothetical protein